MTQLKKQILTISMAFGLAACNVLTEKDKPALDHHDLLPPHLADNLYTHAHPIIDPHNMCSPAFEAEKQGHGIEYNFHSPNPDYFKIFEEAQSLASTRKEIFQNMTGHDHVIAFLAQH